jgi:hypothetical protein
MPMNARLLRPLAPGVHPEAAAWRSAVLAQGGGEPSATTMLAVSRFCKDIDAAGIRDRFYRLNLLTGPSDGSLVAPRVPLYRGPSAGGTQYGDAIDTNNNFVQADYNEAGPSSGLQGDGLTKFLLPGLAGSQFNDLEPHLAVGYVGAETGSSVRVLIGSQGTGINPLIIRAKNPIVTPGQPCCVFSTTSANNFGDIISTTVTLAVGRIIAAAPVMYRNGVASGVVGPISYAHAYGNSLIGVFAVGNGLSFTYGRLNFYSIGLSMTASQAAAYDAAVAAFDAATGRS